MAGSAVAHALVRMEHPQDYEVKGACDDDVTKTRYLMHSMSPGG